MNLMATSSEQTTIQSPSPVFSVVHAPNPLPSLRPDSPSPSPITVFLSGAIDRNKAVSWREYVASKLNHLPVILIDPYRPDWNNTWREEATFEPFRRQVEWELDTMEAANIIVVHFTATEQAPISLLEFGLFARESRRDRKLLVMCPDGYWKKGNVQIVCARFGIPLLDDLDDLVNAIDANVIEIHQAIYG